MLKILFPITLAFSLTLASDFPTISSLQDLEYRGFDDPPRHGLRLLSWFVSKCVDEKMVAKCNLPNGDFGIHQFFNNKPLLPLIWDRHRGIYYTIGNLSAPFSDSLPYHVRKDYNRLDPVTNMDRLVVKYASRRLIEKIYISADYDPFETYLIHPYLIQKLRSEYPFHSEL